MLVKAAQLVKTLLAVVVVFIIKFSGLGEARLVTGGPVASRNGELFTARGYERKAAFLGDDVVPESRVDVFLAKLQSVNFPSQLLLFFIGELFRKLTVELLRKEAGLIRHWVP